MVRLDRRGRPCIRLLAGDSEPTHEVILEQLRPFAQGFCMTCFDAWDSSNAAGRKARSCSIMVRYLSELNRDRSLASELHSQVANQRQAS